jgi:hypothetical protein
MTRAPAALMAMLALLCFSTWPGRAQAQQVELEPSAVAACLAPMKPGADEPADTGLPEYPFAAYKSGDVGRVKVEMHFTGPDLSPVLTVLSSSGDGSFVDAVRQHVRRLRVPCLPPGQEVRLRQEYVFQPSGRAVFWGPAADPRDEGRFGLLKCMKHLSGAKAPDYPPDLLRQGVQGRVLARLRFNNDDQAPAAEVFTTRSAKGLGDAIQEWVRGYRLPCYTGETIATNIVFVFKVEGQAFGFRPMDLLAFAARAKLLKTEGLQMDTRNMGCPFDVKLNYRQPFLRNQVGVLGTSDVRRQPLVDWLGRAELDLPPRQADGVFADTADIHVPCADFAIPPEAPK